MGVAQITRKRHRGMLASICSIWLFFGTANFALDTADSGARTAGVCGKSKMPTNRTRFLLPANRKTTIPSQPR
jgi:hypothetical protein